MEGNENELAIIFIALSTLIEVCLENLATEEEMNEEDTGVTQVILVEATRIAEIVSKKLTEPQAIKRPKWKTK